MDAIASYEDYSGRVYPRRWDDVVGQDAAIAALRDREFLPHTCIVADRAGSGRTAIALLAAGDRPTAVADADATDAEIWHAAEVLALRGDGVLILRDLQPGRLPRVVENLLYAATVDQTTVIVTATTPCELFPDLVRLAPYDWAAGYLIAVRAVLARTPPGLPLPRSRLFRELSEVCGYHPGTICEFARELAWDVWTDADSVIYDGEWDLEAWLALREDDGLPLPPIRLHRRRRAA